MPKITDIRTKSQPTHISYADAVRYCNKDGITDETIIYMTYQKINKKLAISSSANAGNILHFK